MFPFRPIIFIIFGLEVTIGFILIVLGFITDPAEMLDENMALQNFFWLIGAVLVFGATTAAGTLYFIGSIRKRAAEKLKMRGLRGTAKIFNVTSAGRLNNLKRVEIEMEVNVPGRVPYKVFHNDYVTKINSGKLIPETTVNILVDPDNQNKLMIVW